jgi:uncharacterized protein (TIGR00369 family)
MERKSMALAFDVAGLSQYLHEIFPQIRGDFAIDTMDDEGLTMRLLTSEQHLRPGGTVSGPSMFALADCAVYALILSRLGPEALAVTTNCSIDFMRKPAADTDMIAKARLLKLGRALAVADVLMYSDGQDAPVARASMTYSIPPKR